MGHRVLVLGSGGREHALAWKISKSPLVSKVFCAPGNAGTRDVAENHAVSVDDAAGIRELVKEQGIDLVVVGPEGPLVAGIADQLRKDGVLVFGPGAEGARIEGSKIFAKELMRRYGIPTAGSRTFETFESLRAFLEEGALYPVVMKADGLAAGKGVVLPANAAEALAVGRAMMEEGRFGDAGRRVLVEDVLKGREVSLLAVTDGRTVAVLEAAQDFKRIRDGDEGPNTGGMGSFSPAPAATPEFTVSAVREVLVRIVHGLAREGIEYRGLVYAGLMATRGGPKVIEFNCRFGDPETQAILVRMTSDLVPLLVGAASGRLADVEELSWDPRPSVCVVAASAGYPESSTKGELITGLGAASRVPETQVFHAGTAALGDRVVTAGGRVLSVTSLGADVAEARARAYEAMSKISFPGMQVRKDIAARI